MTSIKICHTPKILIFSVIFVINEFTQCYLIFKWWTLFLNVRVFWIFQITIKCYNTTKHMLISNRIDECLLLLFMPPWRIDRATIVSNFSDMLYILQTNVWNPYKQMTAFPVTFSVIFHPVSLQYKCNRFLFEINLF